MDQLQTRTSTSTTASSASAPLALSTFSRASPWGNATSAEGTHSKRVGLGASLGVGLPLFAGLAVGLSLLGRISKGKLQLMQSEEKTASAGIDANGMARQEQEIQELEVLPSEMTNNRREITQELGVSNNV